jgi:hypothetical protein
MFNKFKQWREKWTVDHTIDVIFEVLEFWFEELDDSF